MGHQNAQRDVLCTYGGTSSRQDNAFTRSVNESVASTEEEAPLLLRQQDTRQQDSVPSTESLSLGVMVVLLLGEFLAHADTTLIFAAAPHIASDLGDMRGAGWLATAYTVGVCTMQPLYGKLSDVFGRKHMLVLAYAVLFVGCVFCSVSRTLLQIIVFRAISGIGGAGVMTMASIIITDSVPKRDYAKYRSYINLATTLGRSVGGPLGGWITDAMGWPWLFWVRLPFFVLSACLIMMSLKSDHGPDNESRKVPSSMSFKEKWAKVDYKGAVLLAKTIVSLILLLNTMENSIGTTQFWVLLASFLVFSQLFVFWVLYGTDNPIFDLRILALPGTTLSYLVDYFQVFSQVGMMFSVPLYFQVTQRASTATSGAHIVPAVMANTVGALASGKLVQVTRRHRIILAATGALGAVTYALVFTRWNGNTNFWEALYVIPGGLATGVAQSASFVTMASHLEQKDMAMATGGFFLVSSLGTLSAVTMTNILFHGFFRRNLQLSIDMPDKAHFIKRITSDIDSIARLDGNLRQLVVNAFVCSLKTTYVSGLA
ncbi:hypothetical protein S7711_10438, partial [Stachybotrys chartarum IBT 7711]